MNCSIESDYSIAIKIETNGKCRDFDLKILRLCYRSWTPSKWTMLDGCAKGMLGQHRKRVVNNEKKKMPTLHTE